MAIITLNNNSLSSVTALPAGVGGKVLQVVQVIIGDNTGDSSTTTVDTWLDNKDASENILQASITPSSSSNKILILVSAFTKYHTGTTGHAGDTKIRILNGSTSIFTNTNGYNMGYAYTGGSIRYGTAWSVNNLHSPNSTSQQTHKVQYKFVGSQSYYYGTNDTLTLMEIAG